MRTGISVQLTEELRLGGCLVVGGRWARGPLHFKHRLFFGSWTGGKLHYSLDPSGGGSVIGDGRLKSMTSTSPQWGKGKFRFSLRKSLKGGTLLQNG